MYVSTKTYSSERGYSVAYRQWRADSHCNKLHGYALGFTFEFQSEELDIRNWVVDFGGMKTLKEKLDDWFDHTCLVSQDDPEFDTFKMLHEKKIIKMTVVEKTGCEGLCEFLRDYIESYWLLENAYNGVSLRKIEVRETPSNSAAWVIN